MRLNKSGNVGINQSSPSGTLHVGADALWVNATSGSVGIGTTAPSARLVVMGNLSVNNTDGTSRLWVDTSAGNVGIGTTTPTEVLSVNGNVSIEGTNCRDSGGSATCNNFVDFAELFDSSEPVESGDIVIIDFSNSPSENQLAASQNPLTSQPQVSPFQTPKITSNSFQNSSPGQFQTPSPAHFQNSSPINSKTPRPEFENPSPAASKTDQNLELNFNTENNGVLSRPDAAIAKLNSINENQQNSDASTFKVKKSRKPYDSSAIGIVSTQPAIVIEGGRIIAMGGTTYQNNTLKPAIALAGRVPVKVSTESGIINPGDRITSSSQTGIGMKADAYGSTVGIALERFDGTNGEQCGEYKCGKVIIFVNVGEANAAHRVVQLESENNLLKEDVANLKTRLTYIESRIK